MGWRATQAVLPLDVGSHAAKVVLLCLAARADDEFECWPSYATLAKDACMTRRSAMNQVTKLCELGVLVASARGHGFGQTSNMYKIQVPIEGGESLSPGGESLSPGGSEPRSPESVISESVPESVTSKHGSSQSASELNGKNDLAISGSWTGDNRRVDLHGHLHDEGEKSLAARIAWELYEKLSLGTCWEGIEPGIRRWMRESIAAGHKGATVEQLGNMAASLAVGIARRAGEPL